MMTVTYLSPFRVCRQRCSSTPIVVTPSSRSALSTSSAPATRIASEAVFHATPRLAATRAIDIRIDQDRLDRQHDRLTQQLPLRRRRRRDAVTPDPSTRPAPVARNHHLQDRRFPSERHMRQPAQHRIVSDPRPGAARTRKRRCRGAATQHSVVGFDTLGSHGQPETAQTAERIEAGWGSVSHKGPWVFRCGVDTLILPTRGPASRHQARPNSSPITHRLL